MSASLFMQSAKLIGGIAKGYTQIKGAKKIAKEQEKTATMYYEYNKKQLSEAYNKAFNNSMSNYIDTRLNIANEYQDVNTQLNIQASQSNVNLADSSFTTDAQNQLDMEFTRNMQNAYTNLVNQASDLVVNKTTQDMKLNLQYQNQMNDINNAVTQVENEVINKIGESAMSFGTQAYDEYRASQSKNNLSNNQLTEFKPQDEYLKTDIVDTYSKSKGYNINNFDFQNFKF